MPCESDKNACPFQPGDTVVFREWDDMASEYELDGLDIRIEIDGVYFIEAMRPLCGTTHVVSGIHSVHGYLRVVFEDSVCWSISPCMLAPAVDLDDNYEVDIDSFMSMVFD